MTQEEKKPREFWVCDHGNWYDCRETAFDEQSQSALTHVIEYSAYEQLKQELETTIELFEASLIDYNEIKAKLEKAKEALRFYAGLDAWEPSETFRLDTIEDTDQEFVELIEEGSDISDWYGGKRARAALKEIEE